MERLETQVTPLVSPPVTLQVVEHGDRSTGTHAVLVHGFPNDSSLWDDVVAALPRDWHVVTYDLRGAGRSSRPRERSAYRLALLVEDLIAVLDATVPDGEQVHLVGHDWGSVALWDVVAASTWDPRLEGRIASYTSVSGPPLDHLGTQVDGWRGRLLMLPQAVHSWYVWLFLLPWLPELGWRFGLRPMLPLLRRLDATSDLLPWGPALTRNAVPAVNIYRANIPSRLRRPLRWRTSVPVQVVVATGDRFVTPRTLDHLDARCRSLTRVEVDTGHWVPLSCPEELAGLVRAFAEAHPARPA